MGLGADSRKVMLIDLGLGRFLMTKKVPKKIEVEYNAGGWSL